MIEWSQRAIFLKDIAEGMTYLHSADVYHQDLKTDNVLLGIERGRLRAKISDFGMSNVKCTNTSTATSTDNSFAHQPATNPILSTVSHIGGTRAYMVSFQLLYQIF